MPNEPNEPNESNEADEAQEPRKPTPPTGSNQPIQPTRDQAPPIPPASRFPFIPLAPYHPGCTPADGARAFYEHMSRRRSVRMFSDRPVPREVIEHAVAAAGTAPSGANKQPWRFVAVSDPALKREIRLGAEAEEREFYSRRATREWLDDLAPLGTDDHKDFLEIAPWLIVVFKLMKDDPRPGSTQGQLSPQGEVSPQGQSSTQGQVYYVNESVGIAVGLLLAAIHHAGLVALTHTPSPMAFLTKILDRPDHERPYLLIPVGHPADHCLVPDIHRKPLDQILVFR